MNRIALITASFDQKGFSYRYSGGDRAVHYHGLIESGQYGKIGVEFVFFDRSAVDFPKAYILAEYRSSFDPYHFPHLNDEWELCFHDGSKIFDVYRINDMVAFCIEAVSDLLCTNKVDDMDEIIPEFVSYWNITNRLLYFGQLEETDSVGYLKNDWVFGKEDQHNNQSGETKEIPIFRLTCVPSIQGVEWPIKNLNDLKIWLRDEQGVYTRIEKHIKSEVSAFKTKVSFILGISRLNLYPGIKIRFSNPLLIAGKLKYLQPTTVSSIIKGSQTVARFWIDNKRPKDLILSSSESTDPNLIDQNILLVGAGTIGSNLANILIRNGAGAGADGSLTIVDDDLYMPHNYSRHFLGIGSSGKFKASELEFELKRIAPFLKIDACIAPVQQMNLRKFDIVIDTTGEEALTIWLNERMRELIPMPLFVSTWVFGKGESVQSFSMNDESNSCHECYRKGEYNIPVSSGLLPLRDSCRSVYIPFPITASLHASLLAVHVINRWLTQTLPPTLFCRQTIEPVSGIDEFIIEPNKECPFCGSNCSTV